MLTDTTLKILKPEGEPCKGMARGGSPGFAT